MAVFSCGALPVVLVFVCSFFFFYCNIEAGAPGRHDIVFAATK